MSVGEYCNRETIVIDKGASVVEAARLMRESHVGDLVVAERNVDGVRPIGLLTDRDIVIELVAKGIDPKTVTVGDVMSAKLYTAWEGDDLIDTLKYMRDKGVRRIPVIDRQGLLAGILTIDDMIAVMTEQLTDVTALIGREQRREQKLRDRVSST
jgi:CBS domain-containing protein